VDSVTDLSQVAGWHSGCGRLTVANQRDDEQNGDAAENALDDSHNTITACLLLQVVLLRHCSLRNIASYPLVKEDLRSCRSSRWSPYQADRLEIKGSAEMYMHSTELSFDLSCIFRQIMKCKLWST
jgi:hypothetical protein